MLFKKISALDSRIYFLLIIIVSLLFLEFIYGPLVHETSHSLGCSMAGLNPDQGWRSVECIGIEKTTDLEQFFYFIMPYIIDLILLIFILFFIDNIKYKYVKYFVFVAFFDLVINFASLGFGHSDFLFLFSVTGLNFLFALALSIFILIIILTSLILSRRISCSF